MGRIYKPTRAACSQSPQAQAAGSGEHFFSVVFGMLDVLNATARVTKHPSQRILSLDQRPPSDIVTHDKKIKSQGHGFLIGCAVVQSVEIRNAIRQQTNNLPN